MTNFTALGGAGRAKTRREDDITSPSPVADGALTMEVSKNATTSPAVKMGYGCPRWCTGRCHPHLRQPWERARLEAQSTGELLRGPEGSAESPFDATEREIIASWHSSGGYERAVAEFVDRDPDIATQ